MKWYLFQPFLLSAFKYRGPSTWKRMAIDARKERDVCQRSRYRKGRLAPMPRCAKIVNSRLSPRVRRRYCSKRILPTEYFSRDRRIRCHRDPKGQEGIARAWEIAESCLASRQREVCSWNLWSTAADSLLAARDPRKLALKVFIINEDGSFIIHFDILSLRELVCMRDILVNFQ